MLATTKSPRKSTRHKRHNSKPGQRLPCNRRGSLETSTPHPSNSAGTHLLLMQEMPTRPVPRPPFPQFSADREQPVQIHHKGFRKDYALGEALRSHSHMITEPTPGHAIQAASLLGKHDFAFVRRSDGSFSYAILAYRSREPIRSKKNGETHEDCMTFVMGPDGTTKMIRKRFWSDFVRLVCVPALEKASFSAHAASISREKKPLVLCQEVRAEDNLCAPPKIISFPGDEFGDECSLMSSVSDRARASRRRHIA